MNAICAKNWRKHLIEVKTSKINQRFFFEIYALCKENKKINKLKVVIVTLEKSKEKKTVIKITSNRRLKKIFCKKIEMKQTN